MQHKQPVNLVPSKKLLVFSPFAAIWDHVLPELQIALAADFGGWQVRYLACNGLMEKFCISMHPFRLVESSSMEEKRKICEICRNQNDIRRHSSGLPTDFLEEYLTTEERQESVRTIQSLTADTFMDLEFLGVPVGKLGIYEYLLAHKKNNTQFNKQEWQEIQLPLENCLNVLKALNRYWGVYPADKVLMYNSLYSVNSVAAHFVKQKGASVYFLHHGMSLAQREEEVMIGHNSTLQFLKKIH